MQVIQRKIYLQVFLSCLSSLVIFFLLLVFILLAVIDWKWFFIQPFIWLLFGLLSFLSKTFERLIVYDEAIELKHIKESIVLYYTDITEIVNKTGTTQYTSGYGSKKIEPVTVIKSENEAIQLNRLSYGKKDLSFIIQTIRSKNPNVFVGGDNIG